MWTKRFPGVPPVGPKFLIFRLDPLHEPPCAVADDQWRHAYEGACCTGEVGAGDVGRHYHSGVLYYWKDAREAAQGGLARGHSLGAPVWGPLEGYLGTQ